MTALIDTCVIIDALQSREPFVSDAQAIFLNVANQQFNGYITANSVTDIYYLTHKALHSDKEARKVMSKLFALFDILDTTNLDCRRALSSEVSDFEDAVMVESANRANLDYIVTRNLTDYKKSNVKAISPQEFLQLINASYED